MDDSSAARVLGVGTHARGTTDFGQEAYFVRLDYSAKAKIADHNVCLFAGIPEQQVFWLKVTVDDTTLVEVCDSAEDGSDEICSIPVMGEDEIIHESRNE